MTMGDDLPEQFDLIVIGTGFPESCIAAASSRIGKTVLHIDQNEYYGGVWASFGLAAITDILKNDRNDGELQNCSYTWHETSSELGIEETPNEIWSRDKLLEKSRRFNIDLCPKILYSNGKLVKLLLQSNICRYAEFRAVDHVCTYFENQIIDVPCSRSDVFNTKDLNIVEKRLLMKFLNTCMTYGEEKYNEDWIAFRNNTFLEYLRSQRVTEKILTCVMQAIAMSNPNTSFEDGMMRTKAFLSSLGRYGNTPFLFPMHGCGEIPQCFCRLCAVFGGVYCLKWPVEDVRVDKQNNEVQLRAGGKKLRAKNVVFSHGSIPLMANDHNELHNHNELRPQLSRGIFITSKPMGAPDLNTGGGGVILLRLTHNSGDILQEAILIQLTHYSGTCPEGTFVFHLTAPGVSMNPAQDLAPFVQQVFKDQTNMLFSAYFTITAPKVHFGSNNVKPPIYCVAPPFYELDYDLSIKNAHDIFTQIYPLGEFLPRAPDPEEIVIDGEDPRALSEHSLPEDLREQLHALERMDIA